MYETYVGNKQFQPKDEPVFNRIADAGQEYGATTGRRRQTNWMNMQLLEKAIRMNGVTHVVFNKVDVLREVGAWAVIDEEKVIQFKNEKGIKDFIVKRLAKLDIPRAKIFFSENKEGI